jgi:hypothetical protein
MKILIIAANESEATQIKNNLEVKVEIGNPTRLRGKSVDIVLANELVSNDLKQITLPIMVIAKNGNVFYYSKEIR